MKIRIADQGTVVGFTPMDDEADNFFKYEVQVERWQVMGQTIWVDHRVAQSFINQAVEAGLGVQFEQEG